MTCMNEINNVEKFIDGEYNPLIDPLTDEFHSSIHSLEHHPLNNSIHPYSFLDWSKIDEQQLDQENKQQQVTSSLAGLLLHDKR